MNRPLAWAAASFVCGTWLAAEGWLPPWAVLFLFLLSGAAAIAGPRRIPHDRLAIVLLAFTAAGALNFHARNAGPPGDSLSRWLALEDASSGILTGTVESVDLRDQDDYRVRFVMAADSFDQPDRMHNLAGRTTVQWYRGDRPVWPGQRVAVAGDISATISRVNFGVSSYEDTLRRRGIHSALKASGPSAVTVLEEAPLWSLGYQIARFRQALADRFAAVVPESALPFVNAIWLGDQTNIDRDEQRVYLVTGTAHILAVSGVHVGIVYVSAVLLLAPLVRNPRRRTVGILLIVAIFVLASGLRTGATRAAIMVAMYQMAALVNREPDSPTALSVAGLLFLFWNPNLLYDTGFLLSFTSVASILALAGPIGRRLTWLPRRLRFPASTALAVQMVPLPFVIHFFHVLPFMSLFANLLVIPLLTGVLWLCFFTAVTAFVAPPVAELFGHAIWPLVNLIRLVAGAAADFPVSYTYLSTPSPLAVIGYYFALASVCIAFARPVWRKHAIAVAAVSVVAVIMFWTPTCPPQITFLDVAHGDATFAKSPGGQTMLIDGGDRTEYYDYGERVVAPFLWGQGVRELDYVVATHPDRDHTGGLFFVLRHFTVGRVLYGPAMRGDPLLALAKERGIPSFPLYAGDTVPFEGISARVVHPPRDWPVDASDNESTAALDMTWDGVHVLLTGDIERKAEARLAETNLHIDVLKAPHHGSRTSSTAPFIDAVDPAYTVISTAGPLGRHRLAPEVLAAYDDRGITILRTDQLGAIRLEVVNGVPVWYSARASRGYPVPGISASQPVR